MRLFNKHFRGSRRSDEGEEKSDYKDEVSN